MKFNSIHIGLLIKQEVERQGIKFSSFAKSINTQRQNVERKVFSQKGLDTELLINISEKLNVNFFKYYETDERSNSFQLQKEVKATLTMEMGEEKQDRTFNFLFGNNNIQIKDNTIKELETIKN